MGFFHVEKADKGQRTSELCELFGCKVCPGFSGDAFRSAPEGSATPDVYILSKFQDCYSVKPYNFREVFDRIFEGIPLRYGDVFRCGSNVAQGVIDSCNSFLEKDIRVSKPKIIVGLGETPLNSILNLNIISVWRGREFPIQIGNHVCWFVPVSSPGYLASTLRKNQKKNEHTDIFEKDLKFIQKLLNKRVLPRVEPVEDYYTGIELNHSRTQKDVAAIKQKLESYANQANKIGLDIETHGLKPYMKDAHMLSAAISIGKVSFAFLIDHPTQSRETSNKIKQLFSIFLQNSPAKICHNLNFEAQWFDYMFGRACLFGTVWEDTMAQGYIIDQRQGVRKGYHPLSLDMSVLRYFGFRLKPLSNIDIKQLTNAPVLDLLMYNALDAKYTTFLFHEQALLLQDKGLLQSYRHQVDSARTLAITQNLGVDINWERWEYLKMQYTGRLEEVLSQIESLDCVKQYIAYKGAALNLNADAQLAYILENILKVPASKFTAKSNKYAVDDEVLKGLEEKGVIFAGLVIQYRFLSNMITKYINSIPGYTEQDGILHTNYNALLTRTGRLSSNGPNMQNFPKRKDKVIRSFIYLGERGKESRK